MRSWLRARTAAVLLGVAACALALPTLFGRSFWLRDVAVYIQPMKHYVRERILAGELPLWNPRAGFGRPFLGLVQPGVFYPLNALLLALPRPHGFDAMTAAHLLVAAFGARAWARGMDADETSAAATGAAYALSGYFVALLVGNGTYAYGIAWVPWALAQVARAGAGAGERGAGEGGAGEGGAGEGARALAGRAAVAGLALAAALASGDPMAVYFAAIASLAQALGAGSRAGTARSLAVAAGALALCALVCAAQILPALEVARVARPGGVDPVDAAHFAFHPARLVELAWPGAFGPPHTPRWFVHALYDEGTGRRVEPIASGVYMGLATPVLAACALASPRRRAVDVALAALLVAALLVAVGNHGPAWRAFFAHAPGARLFRYPEKYVALATMALAALAGRGLSAVEHDARRAARVALVAALACVLGAAAATNDGAGVARALAGRLGAVPPDEAAAVVTGQAWRAVAVSLALAALLGALAAGKLAARRARALVAALLALDALAASAALTDWAPSDAYRAPSPFVAAMRRAEAAGGVAPYRLYRPQRLDLSSGDEPATSARATLVPNCGMDDGVAHLDAYDVLAPPDEARVWTAMARAPVRMLQLSNARFALLHDRQVAALGPGLRLVHRDASIAASLVEVEGVAPRAYLATDARAAPSDDDALARMAGPDFVPGRTAVVHDGAPARAASGACAIERYAAEHVRLRCRADRPAYAIVADRHFPGWRATVNGAPAPVLRANVVQRAVAVPAGASVVELAYRPHGLRGGLVLSVIGLVTCAGLLAWSRRGRRAELLS